jgi:outer membrane protein, heavy metal efflux system
MEKQYRLPCLGAMVLFVCSITSNGVAQINGSTATNQSSTISSPTLPDLIAELLRNSSSVQAARYRYDAALKRPSQGSALPEPKISLTNFGVGHPLSGLNGSDFAYYGVGISQDIPYPGKLALASEEAGKEAEMERQRYLALVADLTAQLKAAYYEWYGVSKALEITQQNRTLLEHFESIARARYEVGKGTQAEVLRSQVEQSNLAQQLAVLEQKEQIVEARIHALLNSERPLGSPASPSTSPISASLESLLSKIEIDSPRLGVNRAEIDGRSVGIERAKKDYRPDFGISFQWQKTGSPFPDYYMATFDVKVPLYFWRKQRLGVEEAAARFQEARQDYLAERQNIIYEVKNLYFTAKTSERLLELYDSGVLRQSSLALESSVAGYQVGNVDYLTVMNNFMTVLTYQVQYHEEIAKHAQAKAQLEALTAMEL